MDVSTVNTLSVRTLELVMATTHSLLVDPKLMFNYCVDRMWFQRSKITSEWTIRPYTMDDLPLAMQNIKK